jgi:cellulose 1,4-beta-cellobiosidase
MHILTPFADSVSKIADLQQYLSDASALGKSSGNKQLLQIVVYDLPDRDCAAKSSNGEFSIANNGQANYFNYIDQIVAAIKRKYRLLSKNVYL